MFQTTSNALTGFNETVISLGGDPVSLLAHFDMKADIFDNPNTLVPSIRLIQLLEYSATQLKCEHFGLLLASNQPEVYMGLLGPVMCYCETLRSAIQVLTRYLAVQSTGINWHLDVTHGVARMRLQFRDEFNGDRSQVTYLALMHIKRTFMYVSNSRWSASRYYFSFRPPQEIGGVRRLLGSAVNYDSEFNGIEFDAELLNKVLPNNNPYMKTALESLIAPSINNKTLNFLEEVQKVINSLLLSGNCSVERVASFFSCDKRTLQRRLKALGAGYQSLLDSERFNIGKHQLSESDISITRLSEQLGYSEQSVFSRAFKKETGLSPNNWRKKLEL